MAKVSIYLDKRFQSAEYPLKLRIGHNNKSAFISTGVKIPLECWDAKEGKVIDHEKAKVYNDILSTKLTLAEATLLKLSMSTNINKYSVTQLRDLIENNGEEVVKEVKGNFLKYFEQKQSEQKKKNTYTSYGSAISRMKRYDPLLSIRTFEDIDEGYLRKMDAQWEKEGLTTNSRAVYMRNIRSVFNSAIDDQVTQAYPFRRFSIKKAPTAKRNLSVEELRVLRDFTILSDYQRKYRDIFMLCFYLRGINMVDLLALTSKNIRAGRINYVRAKTGKQYSVKIEPEAKVILDRYKGTDFLLDICDGCQGEKEFESRYKGFLKYMNKELKKIGTFTRKGRGGKKHIDALFPDISQYWSRHTTATLMAEIGYSNEIIACSLGHEFGIKTTNIYIEYKQSVVDEANRKLIDYVNG